MLGEIIDRMSLRLLYACSMTSSQFATAFQERCQELASTLMTEAPAGTGISIELLLTVARFMWRIYLEWTVPNANNVIQDPAALQFHGPNADGPFPALRHAIQPTGNIIPWEEQINAPPHFHATLISGFHAPGIDEPQAANLPLRDVAYVRILISTDNYNAYIKILIHKKQVVMPMRLFIQVSSPHIAAYPAWCGALILLFFNQNSELLRVPRPFRDCILRVRIMLPNDLPPNAPLNLPQHIRYAFATVIVGLQRPDVVPNSGLQIFRLHAHGHWAFHNVPLSRVLY
jgi:hypothetical protein